MTDVFAGLTGTDDLLLPAPRFVPLIGVSVTTFPPGAAVMDLTSPRRVMKVGWVSPGRLGSDPSWPASLFFEDAKWIDFEREMITYPTPGIYCDRIRYHLEPGAVATIYVNDTGVPAVPSSVLAPWDRHPVQLQKSANTNMGGGASGTLWTHTVTTSKLLWLSSASIQLVRTSVATTAVMAATYIYRNGFPILTLFSAENIVGHRQQVVLGGGPHILNPSDVLSCAYVSNDTAGNYNLLATASGFEFDI